MGLFSKIKRAFKKVVKAIGNVIKTVVTTIFSLVELIVGVFLDAINYVVGFILSMPVLGRLLRWIWNAVLTLVWIFVGAVEWFLEQLGVSIEKKLRCCVIVLEDENNVSVLENHPSGRSRNELLAAIRNDLQTADDIFRLQANVKLVPPKRASIKEELSEIPIVFHSNKGSTIKPYKTQLSYSNILDVNCDESGSLGIVGQDLLIGGSKFELLQNRYCFENGYRSLIGLGSTVAIFVIRTVDQMINTPAGPNDSSGCSAGFLANYVIIEPFRSSNSVIAHELGHSCSLFHVDKSATSANPSLNLMGKPREDTKLNKRQRFFFRSSKNVSAF